MTTRLASGAATSGRIDFRLDSTTGGWQKWVSTIVNTGNVTGVHRLYLTFTGASAADFVNVNWFQFNR